MGRVEELWRSYAEAVVPPTAGPTQRLECERAFYAGASSLFTTLLSLLDGTSDEATDEEVNRFDAVAQELLEYAENAVQEAAS